jgi:hypothetical protein
MNNAVQPLVSVIVCFYNEQNYLTRCLQSILNQTYKNIQVILVNDGSTDNSLTIAQSFENKFNNAQIISITNAGLGAARNHGLKHAHGEFLTFLDADDELLPEMIESCCNTIIKTNAQLVACRFSIVNTNNIQQPPSGIKEIDFGEYSSQKIILKIYRFKIASTVWAKLYNTSIAKNIAFPTGVWFEDRPYLLRYALQTNKAVLIPDNLLLIHNRKNSITRQLVNPRRITDLQIIFETELQDIQQSPLQTQYKYAIAKHHMHTLLDNLLLIIDEGSNITERQQIQKCFKISVHQTVKIIEKENIKLLYKDVLMLQLLLLPNKIGWFLSGKIILKICAERAKAIRSKKA